MKAAATNFLFRPLVAVVLVALLAHAARGAAAPTTPAPAVAAAATTRPAAPPVLRDLLVHGTSDYLWMADVVPPGEDKPSSPAPSPITTVRFRTTGDPQWRPSAQFEAAPASLGSRGSELLVALESGEWRIVADSGARSGMALPGGAAVLAVAGDGEALWAVGAAPKGMAYLEPPATRPSSTRPATTTTSMARTTAAATRTPRGDAMTVRSAAEALPPPSLPPHDLGLFRLDRGTWQEVDALPAGLRRDAVISVALLPTDHRLLLAVATEDLAVRVYWRPPDGAAGSWAGGDEPVAVLPAERRVKLMSYAGRPLLWLAEPGAPGSILLGSAPAGPAAAATPAAPTAGGRAGGRGGQDEWGAPIKLQPVQHLAKFDRRDLAVALGRIRLIATDGEGRIAEQIYESDGSPAGALTEAVATPMHAPNPVGPAVELLVLLILFLSMIGAMRQRPNLAEAVRNSERLRLAPLSRRFAGGVIDMLPMLICGYIGLSASTPPAGEPGTPMPVTWESAEVRWIVGGILLYLAHTTLLEVLTARSLGKFITGTRVAALDGSVPRVAAVLTRNLLRPLDALLLVLLYLSPLRQRVGDMAAGTLVVLAAAPPTAPPTPPQGTGEDESPEQASRPAKSTGSTSDPSSDPPSPPAPPQA